MFQPPPPSSSEPGSGSGQTDRVAIAMALFDGLNAGDLRLWQSLLDEAFEGERVGNRALNRAETIGYQQAMLEAFAGLKVHVFQTFASGDSVALHWTATGSHLRAWRDIRSGFTIPATGRGVILSGVLIQEISGSKIRRVWNHYDRMALLEQLGMLPQ
jgi:predicted ester cyclase